MKGKVKWFNVKKRFGYITDENGNDTFVHVSGIKEGRTWTGFEEGDEVEFDTKEGKKGIHATDVVLTKRVEENESENN